jgi:hypothetical protein
MISMKPFLTLDGRRRTHGALQFNDVYIALALQFSSSHLPALRPSSVKSEPIIVT